MQAPLSHRLKDQQLWLSPTGCIFWEEAGALIFSDTHFGKTGHFRKSGIAVPQHIYKEDLQRFFDQVAFFKPKKILVIGDFFHSTANKELDLFLKWRKDVAHIPFILIRGNHDILTSTWYLDAAIQVEEKIYTEGPFGFVHDPIDIAVDEHYFFCGHIHPGIRMGNGSRQSLCFPCFFFESNKCTLPAFSKFTGLKILRPKKTDQVFIVTNEAVIANQ